VKIKLTLENLTPLLVGGKKPANSNYIQSLDHIPGQVLRAAFAREITTDCPYRHWDDNINDTPFWVSFLDKEHCCNCRWRVFCQQFDRILFAPAYPKGGIPVTAGARRCKYHKEHRLVEPWQIEESDGKCPDCGERLDSESGYYLEQSGKKQALKVSFCTLTRLAISPRTLKARDGNLYTITAIRESLRDKRQYFVTTLHFPEADAIALQRLPQSMWVGSQTGRGLGYCQLTWEQIDEEKKEVKGGRTRLLFYSDVKIPVELLPREDDDIYQASRRALQTLINEAVGSDEVELKEWSIQSEWRRSYTLIGSKQKGGGRWQGPFVLLLKGSYIVVTGTAAQVEKLIQIGIGQDRPNGFGLLKLLED